MARRPGFLTGVAALIAVLTTAAPAPAQTKVRVGQPQAGTFQFVPLQVGSEAGIFKKHGIDLEVIRPCTQISLADRSEP